MAAPSHIIKRQVLDLEFSAGQDALELQRTFGRLYQEQVLPRVAARLDREFSPELHLRIPHIEVDLGRIRTHQEWVEACVEALVEEVGKEAKGKAGTASLPPFPRTREEALLDRWYHFLFTGSLSWWNVSMASTNLEASLNPLLAAHPQEIAGFITLLLTGQVPADKAQGLRRWEERIRHLGPEQGPPFSSSWVAKNRKVIFQRLVLQFSDSFLLKLFNTLLPAIEPKVSQLLQAFRDWVHAQQPFSRSWKEIRLRFWRETFSAGVDKFPGVEPHRFSQKVLSEIIPVGHQAYFVVWVKDRASQELWQLILRSRLWEGNSRQNPHPDNFQRGEHRPLAGEKAFSTTSETGRDPFGGQERMGDPTFSPEAEPYYINNSGLVLFRPYLLSFLEAVNVQKGGSFIDTESQIRALHLLQYLVDFQEHAPEHQLPLNKLLCGWPLDVPVEKDLTLSAEVQAEARHLIQSVIGHWQKLRNTSVAVFQESFLQRAGKLCFRKSTGTWLLQVEPQSYDLLLDALPWTYTRIALPWMEAELDVEWY